jgi:hypothetical protein
LGLIEELDMGFVEDVDCEGRAAEHLDDRNG